MATERDAWQSAHASKTNPPDALKYRTKPEFIWEKQKETTIYKPVENIGAARIQNKKWQHSFLCDRITKTLNDPGLKAKLEAERRHLSAEKKKRQTIEEEQATIIMNEIYRKKEEVAQIETRHPPGTVFTTSYNPKGEKIVNPCFAKQDIAMKLHRDNWAKF